MSPGLHQMALQIHLNVMLQRNKTYLTSQVQHEIISLSTPRSLGARRPDTQTTHSYR